MTMLKKDYREAPDLQIEKRLWNQGYDYVLGMDEAGRGAWAGSVTVGAVIYNADEDLGEKLFGVRDSKQMTARQRTLWAERIKDYSSSWSVGSATEKEIDSYGIVKAVQLAASRAIEALHIIAQYMIIDYFHLPSETIPQESFIKGDRKSITIASASILAKTKRDEMMISYGEMYTFYGFAKHKGYGTREHCLALKQYGISPIHRLSFLPMKGMVNP